MTDGEFLQMIAERLYGRLYNRLLRQTPTSDPLKIAQIARDIVLGTPMPDRELNED